MMKSMSATVTVSKSPECGAVRISGWADTDVEPENVLPEQFFNGAASDAAAQPAKRLMLAVLEQAVRDYTRLLGRDSRPARKAVEDLEVWFASDSTEWPCSFASICDILGLERNYVRSLLGRVREACDCGAPGGPARVRRFRRRTGVPRRVAVARRDRWAA